MDVTVPDALAEVFDALLLGTARNGYTSGYAPVVRSILQHSSLRLGTLSQTSQRLSALRCFNRSVIETSTVSWSGGQYEGCAVGPNKLELRNNIKADMRNLPAKIRMPLIVLNYALVVP